MENYEKINIIVDDTNYLTKSTPAFNKRKKWKNPNDNIIKSIIPGTVVEIFVKPGDVVKDGDKMMIVEAMKMNNEFFFHREGKIKLVHVRTKDIITKGQSLIELE